MSSDDSFKAKSPSIEASSLNHRGVSDEPLGAPLLPKDIEAAEEAETKTDNTRALVISFIMMVLVGLGNKIFQVLQFIPMNNYPLFVNLMSTFIYLPASFAYIIPMTMYGSQITDEARAIPKRIFAVMGGLDSLAGIMQSLAVNYIANGSLVVLLSQAAIPFSMIISKIFLGTKYKGSQYIGAIIVAVGIIVVLMPSFIHPDSNGKARDPIVWSIVMLLSCIPMCLSSVYKEKALGDTEIDVVYMNGWIAVFQLLFAIPLLIPSAIASDVKLHDLPTNLWDGVRCLGRYDSILTGKNADDCTMAPVYVSIYLCFNLAYNILILLIIKFGSSNILWLAMTVLVPLANASFALKFMPDHKPLEWEDLLGLTLIMIGLLSYRFWSSINEKFCKKPEPPSDKLQPLIGSESPAMSTPMRGTGVHSMKKKRTTSR